jgi:glutamate synthase domain-containing protein 1
MMRYVAKRERAPHREGQRTTLRVPAELVAEADDLAREIGTSSNDALIRLAERGADARRRAAVAARLAEQRRAAVFRTGFSDAIEFPSAEELRDAMLSGRVDES